MRLFTSYFANRALRDRSEVKVGIVQTMPKWLLPYPCAHLKMLAPSWHLWQIDDSAQFERLYHHQLDAIRPARIFARLKGLSDDRDIILLCFEKDPAECHRGDFAKWWLRETGQTIEELPRPAPRVKRPKNQLALPLDSPETYGTI